jgi:hypothetical protein
MKYTVVYTPFADYQLADIWLRAKNRQQVTDSANKIESMLRHDADQLGLPRRHGHRVIVKPPLVFTFEVSVDDRLVTVLSIRYLPPSP